MRTLNEIVEIITNFEKKRNCKVEETMTPIKQVIFKRLDTLYMTDEENYKARIPNASKLIKLEGFNNYEEVVDYMWSWKHITRDYLIDMTGKESW